MTEVSLTKPKIYYGWVIVATCFIIFTVAFGIQFCFGIFFRPLQESLGWSRATISWAMTIHLLVYVTCIALVGWVIDRFKTRIVFSIAALVVGVSLVLCSRISQPWQLYLLYGVGVGMGISACGPALMAIVARWFTEHRGLALGIASAGVGFGTLIGAPISNWLIVSLGWRNSFIALGITGSLILLVCAGYIKSSPPSATNQSKPPDRLKNGLPSRERPPEPRLTFWQALKTREMALLMVAHIAAMFTLRLVQVHIATHAMDIGISPATAALAVGTIGAAGIVGRLVMGFAQDRIGAKPAIILCLAAQGMAMLALPLIKSDLIFFGYAVIFGFTYGGDMTQIPTIIAQTFGMASMITVYSFASGFSNLVGSLGPLAAGYLFDATASYTLVLLGAAIGLLVGVFCIWRLKPRQ